MANHQHTTRIVLDHAIADVGAQRVDQSIDTMPFGLVSAIRDAAGALVETSPGTPNLAALDTAYGHHGSVLDAKSGLQLKGARWYSPQVGRFISVDPAEDGTNWYAFAGNDPVNASDPSGLSQAGHPLSSTHRNLIASNPISAPSYKLQSTSFDTSLRTSAGPAINSRQQIGLASTAYTPYSPPPKVRFIAPPLSPKNQAVRDYIDWQDRRAWDAMINNELADIADRNRGAWGTFKLWDNDVVAQNTTNLVNTGSGFLGAVYGGAGTAIADNVGVSRLESARTAKDFYGNPLNGGEQFTELVMGGFQIGTTALGLKTPVMRAAGGLRTVTPPSLYGSSFADDATFYRVAGDGIDLGTYEPNVWYEQPVQQPQGNGSYTNRHRSGKSYSGKGDQSRMHDSALEKEVQYGDPVVYQDYTPAADTKQSFIDEQVRIEANGGPGGNTYNKINSPGKKLRDGR